MRGNKAITLRQRLAVALKNEQSILDKTIAESRDASGAEQIQLDRIAEQKADITKQLKELEELNDQIVRAAAGEIVDGIEVREMDANGGDGKRAASSGIVFRDTVSGQEYRALTPRERLASANRSDQQLSLGKILRGALLKEWDGAREERDAFSGLSGAGGGFMLPTTLSDSVVDAARNAVRVVQAGALTVSVPSREVTICRVSEDASASYKVENAAASDTGMQFSPITLSARTLVACATLSQEILQDAANLESVVTNALGEALALEMDRASLFGTGAGGEPEGLYQTSDVNEVTPNLNGFQIADYDEFSSAIQKIEDANGVAVAAIYSPRTAAALRELKENNTGAYLQAPEFFTGLKRFTTNQVPNNLTVGTATTCSAAFIGDFSQFLFAVRQGLRVDVSETAGESWQRYQFKIRCTLRYDCVALRPAHFSIIRGIKP